MTLKNIQAQNIYSTSYFDIKFYDFKGDLFEKLMGFRIFGV